MNQRKFFLVVSAIFLIIALLHILRVVFSWEAVIGGWRVPLWLSYGAILIAGALAFQGIRLTKSSPFNETAK